MSELYQSYTLPDKGHFGSGQLAVFDAKFFAMPQGRSEDWLLIDFRNRLMELDGNTSVDRNQMWAEFRDKVETSLKERSTSVDMGMDRGI